MERKDIRAFDSMIVLITIGEVLGILLIVLYFFFGGIFISFYVDIPALIILFVIVGALLIAVLIISSQFKKAVIRCTRSVTEDVNRLAEKVCEGVVTND